jgi:hypothetical protein
MEGFGVFGVRGSGFRKKGEGGKGKGEGKRAGGAPAAQLRSRGSVSGEAEFYMIDKI